MPASPAASGYAYAELAPAPELRLTDQDGRPFELASLRGRPVLVFFGYTHCPDVCPATVGIINEALAAAGDGPRAVFTTVDPERDDVASLRAYLRYLPAAYVGLTGTAAEVRENADRWGVKYARQEIGLVGRVRHGPHGGRLPRGRGRPAAGPLPVRGHRGADRRGPPGAPRGVAAPVVRAVRGAEPGRRRANARPSDTAPRSVAPSGTSPSIPSSSRRASGRAARTP